MEEDIEKLKKKLRKQGFEFDENSDIPVHERYTKEEDFKSIKKRKREQNY